MKVEIKIAGRRKTLKTLDRCFTWSLMIGISMQNEKAEKRPASTLLKFARCMTIREGLADDETERRCKKPRWGRGDGTGLLRAGNGGTRSGQESAAVFLFCRNAGMERGIPQGIDHRAYFGARPVSSKRCIGGANGSVGKDSPCIYICVITARHFWQSVVLLHSSHPLQNATGLPSVAIATWV